jgi:hypothetical protein
MSEKPRVLWDGDTFEHEGFTFKVKFEYDPDADRPWENCDGHGPVREVQMGDHGHPNKRPGERILNRNPSRREYIWAYDWAEACRLAKKDGWDAAPYGEVDSRSRVERAVKADFDFLAGWVNDDWQYIGVIVTLMVPELDDDGDETGDYEKHDGLEFMGEDALWNVEGTDDYRTEVAYECAGNIISSYRHALSDNLWAELAQQREDIEARYWAERDVVTA